VLLVITAWRARETHARLKTTATLLLAVTVLQVLLGAVAVVTVVPLALVTLHNTLAALLLLALVHLNHLLYYRPART
jgi:cytochrome c oxidase assembly protein subunit 15